MADFKLLAPARAHLDTIVHQMTLNNEKPENIQNVVNDFKSKYGVDHSGAQSLAAGNDPRMKGVSQSLVGNLAKTGGQIAIGAAKGAVSTVNSLAKGGQAALSQTAGRAANILTGQGNKATPVASVPANVLNTQNKDQRIGYGAEQVGEFVAPFAGSLAEKGVKAAGEGFAKVAERSAAKDTWELVKPELTKTGAANAAKAGKLTEGAVSGAAKPAVDKELVDAAKQYLKGAKTPLQAVTQLDKGISTEATTLRNGLKATKTPWSVSELQTKLDSFKLPNSLKSDATLTNSFNNAKADILDLAGKANKTSLDGGLDVRQQFDKIMKDDFGDRIFNKTDGVSSVYKNLRNLLTDFVDERLPDGKLPNGTSFKASLKKQSLLYRAIDNVVPKIKIGEATTKVGKAGALIKGAVSTGAVLEGAHKLFTGRF